MFSQEMLLKAASTLASGYMKKNPDKKIKVSITQVADYISKNYPDYSVRIESDNGDTILSIGLKPDAKK